MLSMLSIQNVFYILFYFNYQVSDAKALNYAALEFPKRKAKTEKGKLAYQSIVCTLL